MNKKHTNRAEPDTRSKRIADLKHAVEELVSGRKKPEQLEGIISEAKTLAREWKDPHSAHDYKDRRPLFDGTCNNTTFLLAGLVVALSPDHHLLESIRRQYPKELEKLTYESSHADIAAAALGWKRRQPGFGSKQKYERKRRRWHRGDVGLIEYQFGGARGTELLKRMSLLRPGDPLYELLVTPYWPTCLDGIFAGHAVNMLRLEELFGMDRHRLAEALERVRRRGRYDYLDIVKIMNFLLKEKPGKKRKQAKPGRPPLMPWLNGNILRTRVLSGIEGRINSLSMQVPEHIKAAFVAIIRRHLPDSGKK